MTTSDFLGLYDAKVTEYLLALAYLLLFVPMWRYVHARQAHPEAVTSIGAAALARQEARARAARAAAPSPGWFHLPEGVALDAGHAWARVEADGLVTVGLDDFAQKLVDPERVLLPAAGG